MDILKHDERNITLTPEFVEKSDKDIATIKALDKFATSTGNILVVSSGYATEALCGGQVTRAHGDIDAYIILTGNDNSEDLFKGIQDLLIKEETKWKMINKIADKFEFREVGENKDFFVKRRLELKLNTPHTNNIKYSKKNLVNSKGEKVLISVVDLNEMVLQKVNKFYILKDGVDTSKDRHSSVSDFFDLKRLLFQEDLDKKLFSKNAPEEYSYAISLMNKYNYLLSGV